MKQKTILILGNGFDLSCNLESRFSNFITNGKMANYLNTSANTQNFWYLLFSLKYYSNFNNGDTHPLFKKVEKPNIDWMDIEGFIKEVCVGEVVNYYSSIGFKSYLEIFKILHYRRFDPNYFYADPIFNTIKKFFAKRYYNINDTSELNVAKFLETELLNFKRDFSTYLVESITKTKNYYSDAKKLLAKLGCSLTKTYLIDFNYTHDDKVFSNFISLKNVNYIHGSIPKGIIIGYDSSNIANNNDAITLSKSWQKMLTKYKMPELPTTSDNIELKFFGHSLGEQDYSYFHALFDKFDIYNNKVQLTFVYKKYGKTEQENNEIENTQCENVYKLLNNYASRSGKENEYKTIISRLQIENRLHIYSLDNYSDNGILLKK